MKRKGRAPAIRMTNRQSNRRIGQRHGTYQRTVHGPVGPGREHHADERGGQQHCQRQHHRVQVQPGPFHSAILRNGSGGHAPFGGQRRLQSKPARPGRVGGQHRAGFHARGDPVDRRRHRHGHRRLRFLRHQERRHSAVHAQRRVHAQLQQPVGHRHRVVRAGLHRRRHRHNRSGPAREHSRFPWAWPLSHADDHGHA